MDVLPEPGSRVAEQPQEDPPAREGHLLLVALGGKADPRILGLVLQRVRPALRDRTELFVLDALGLEETYALSLEDVLACSPGSLEPGAVADARRTEEHRSWTEHVKAVAAAARRLRSSGHHVLLVGPYLSPLEQQEYAEVLGSCADGLVLLGITYELPSYMHEPRHVMADAVPQDTAIVLAYDDPLMPSPPAPPACDLHLGRVVPGLPEDGLSLEDVVKTVAPVLGIPHLVHLGTPAEPSPAQTLPDDNPAWLPDRTEHHWEPAQPGSRLCRWCDSLEDEAPHPQARSSDEPALRLRRRHQHQGQVVDDSPHSAAAGSRPVVDLR